MDISEDRSKNLLPYDSLPTRKMGDIDVITEQIKDKKDRLLDMIQSGVKNESEKGAMEKYTKEDKNKLNDLIKTFSAK